MKTHQRAVNCAVTEICIQGRLFKKLGMTSPRGVDCMANSNATTSVQFPRSYPTSSRSCPPGWLVALYTTKRGWCTFWRLLNNGGWEDGRKVECFFLLLLCTTTHTMEQRCFWSFLFDTALYRGAFCQFPFRWIYCYGSNKSTGKETGKTHLCALHWCILLILFS